MPVCDIELQWVTTQAKRNVHDMFRWHTRAWLLGALSKEVRRRKCSNCLTPTITKQSNLIPWSSYLHLCVVSTCSPPLDIWWCLQISPTSSIFGKEVRAWRKYLEIVSTADRTINRYFFLVCQVGRISQTAIAYICSFAVPQLRWWITLITKYTKFHIIWILHFCNTFTHHLRVLNHFAWEKWNTMLWLFNIIAAGLDKLSMRFNFLLLSLALGSVVKVFVGVFFTFNCVPFRDNFATK